MTGRDFSFNGNRLSDFGMMLTNPEEEDNWGMTKEIVKSEVNINKTIANHYGSYFSETTVLNFYILKDVCDNDNLKLTYDEIRALTRWLTSPKMPKSLYVESEDYTTTEYIGIFTNVQPVEYNGINGLFVEFTCNSPYAFQPHSFRTNGGRTLRINCETDELYEYIYPVIHIFPNGTGTYEINNQTTGDDMSLTLSTSYDEIILDGKNQRITGVSGTTVTPLTLSDVGLNIVIDVVGSVETGLVTIPWVKMQSGANVIAFTGDAKFTLIYNTPIKIGGGAYVQF